MKRRNKYLPIIALLSMFLLMYLAVNAMHSIKIYFVYSTGIGPLLFIGFILVAMVVLFLKGMK